VYSTLGSEAALWTLGVMALTGHKAGMKTLRHLLSIPLLAMAAAVIVILLRDNLFTAPNFAFLKTALVTNATGAVLSSLELFGHATIPIAMLIAGSRMADLNRGLVFTPVQVTVAALRLVIIPAAAILLLLLLPLQPEVRKILLLVAIMPSAISSVMLSEIYNGNAEFAASSVLVTHVGALLTVPVWLALWL
jgi:predicted permease